MTDDFESTGQIDFQGDAWKSSMVLGPITVYGDGRIELNSRSSVNPDEDAKKVVELLQTLLPLNLQRQIYDASAQGISDGIVIAELAKDINYDVETFTEYGISYAGSKIPRSSWNADYDVVMRDCANRINSHGDTMGEISVVQRVTTIKSTKWEPAVRPVKEDDNDPR